MISIKKYLDKDSTSQAVEELEPKEFLEATSESYKSVLRAIGKSALRACPTTGSDLEKVLAELESTLSVDTAPEAVKQTEELVEEALGRWGALTAEHLKAKADEVRELLIMLARTAESVGERDQRYSSQFGGLTADLQAIANLDDLTQVRSTLVRKATELKSCVDQMAQDGEDSITQLRSKLSVYETRLKAVEKLAAKDALTGLANRRSVEERMEWSIAMSQTFCVVVLDLNLFKAVNDQYGHLAGDDLLKKFSLELQKRVRADDLVGRWGGDEFVIVLSRGMDVARSQVQRIREWVFGNYSIETGTGKGAVKINVAASIGLAQWECGATMQQVVEQADAAMYLDKQMSGAKRA